MFPRLLFSDGGGFQFRYFSQAPDKYFWIFGCLNGTTQSWNTCPFKFFDLAIPDIRPGKAGEINLSGLPWHLIAQDLRIIGIKFSDPDMTYIWQGPGILAAFEQTKSQPYSNILSIFTFDSNLTYRYYF